MRPFFAWLFYVLTIVQMTPVLAVPEQEEQREGKPCSECHQTITRSFGETRMAKAATGDTFITEWNTKKRPTYCLNCHAPSGGQGIACADCHGPGPHPYQRVPVPEICGRCHDAPGESTVRRFMDSAAARLGKNCLDCHLPDTGPAANHRFEGPSIAGFLDKVATVRIMLRRNETQGATAVLQVSHKAGHALPGGTTGRSVWLIVQGLDEKGGETWRETVRFGWEHHPGEGWLDRTLQPDRSIVLELPESDRASTVSLRARLLYRFRPGPLEMEDPKEVVMDVTELALH